MLMVMLFSIATVQGGCKKDDPSQETNNNNNNNNNNNQAPTENRLAFTENGNEHEFTESFGAIYIDAFGFISLSLSAENADGESISLSINVWNNSTGTFAMQPVSTSNIAAVTWSDSGDDSWTCPNFINDDQTNPATGTMVIDYYDGDKVSGTFTGTLASQNSTTTYEVSGSFSAITIN